MVKKGKKKPTGAYSFLGNLGESLSGLNNSKFFAGLVMILLNIGSKYITIKISTAIK